MADWVDLRSDTVTVPTPEMRRAMADAEVGDDQYGEDPTVNRLESLAAEAVGKAAALFVPSGTMGNQIALLAHSERGQEFVVEAGAHIYNHEAGGPAMLGGLLPRTLAGREGRFAAEDLRAVLRPANLHFPPTCAVCLENTHNAGGGTVWTVAETAAVAREAHARGLAVHLDGARIFHAAVALDVPAARLCAPADSVMFCLSKGLCAPVGSLLCGPAAFVARARRYRQVLGGAMRQAGVVAAAGIVALATGIDRLAEDHDAARRLADGVAGIPGMRLAQSEVRTNIVQVELTGGRTGAELARALAAHGVRVNGGAGSRVRLVTHRYVDRAGVDRALAALAEVTGRVA